jgi:hypothetical protein
MSKPFLGAELDWFAVDKLGSMALFATAGSGFVADSVDEFRVMHETVANSIEYPNWGSDQIWDDAAALGLYVFDWQMPNGPYLRAASPSKPVDAQIQLMVNRITDLPTYIGSFASTQKIANAGDFRLSS